MTLCIPYSRQNLSQDKLVYHRFIILTLIVGEDSYFISNLLYIMNLTSISYKSNAIIYDRLNFIA